MNSELVWGGLGDLRCRDLDERQITFFEMDPNITIWLLGQVMGAKSHAKQCRCGVTPHPHCLAWLWAPSLDPKAKS